MAVFGRQEALGNHVVDEAEEGLIIAPDIKQPGRLAELAQLVERPDLHELLQRANPARRGDERSGEVCHPRLPVPHMANDLADVQIRVPVATVGKTLRDHAVRLSARGNDGIGQQTHQSLVGAAIDQCHAALADRRAQQAGSIDVAFAQPRVRTAEHGDGLDAAGEGLGG